MITDAVEVRSNFELVARERGKRVLLHEGHNVFLDQGRQWLRDLVCSGANYPVETGDRNLTGNAGQSGNADSFAVGGRTYRVRYVGVGVGGHLQTVTPPGPGGQKETANVTALERPVRGGSSLGVWLKQVLPHTDTTDTKLFPTATTVRFRAIFGYGDVSFTGNADPQGNVYGTSVPLSEFALYTSRADSVVQPSSLGTVAYHVTPPYPKTPNWIFELAWTLRF